MPLREFSALPPGLLDRDATELHEFLGGPTLIRLPGQVEPALFLSVLLHGNETSGWDGLRAFLRETAELPRALTIYIGNTLAAASSMRALPDQPDFNRIWRRVNGQGSDIAAALRESIAETPFFAAVDLHNNTGHNPYYSVLTDINPPNLGLAYLFSDKAVYVEEPDTVLTRLFEDRCPAVALEVGPVGDPRCTDRVSVYLSRCLALGEVPEAPPAAFELFRTRVRVHVPDGVEFCFEGDGLAHPDNSPLVLTGGLEAVNFHNLTQGTVFGVSHRGLDSVLRVLDVDHRDVTGSVFEKVGQEIRLKDTVVPAMYTTDPYVIRQDCLCYFMERMTGY